MPSNLPTSPNSFFAKPSDKFREKLLAKNLTPYRTTNYKSEPYQKTEFVQSDLSPVNQEDISNELRTEAENGTILNLYATTDFVDAGELINTVSLFDGVGIRGQYSVTNTEINTTQLHLLETKNRFLPDGGYKDLYFVTENILNKDINVSYPQFVIGEYTVYDILNGPTTSSDSYLQQLSLTFLRETFQQRVAQVVERQTIGRVNLQAFSNPFDAALLASGQEPVIYRDYTITVPDGIFDQAAFFLQKISGTYIPVSPIEGQYLTDPQNQKSKLGQWFEGTRLGKLATKLQNNENPSTKFLANTGSGQKSVLFNTISYNRYKPAYDLNRTQVGEAIDNIFNRDNNIGSFYVGNETNEISQITSPPDKVPIDAWGNTTRTPVYGDDKISKVYEGEQIDNIQFGLNGAAYTDQPRLDGGFTWVNPETVNEAGKFQGGGGELFGQSPSYRLVSSTLESSESSKVTFKPGSILDNTQRLINSAPKKGKDRLSHVGNAINQLSKVFNDGYKELTKGSKVKKYVNKNGVEVGTEYGRVFTKDIPYFTYSNLQSTVANTSGGETNGNIRRFSYSVLDSTYNLNIAPIRGVGSTNIVGEGENRKVKKYMFSIENLAWKNSPEYEDLPACEKGPNGGRVMWFPPYELTYSDGSSPKWNETNFIGRPEPIFTYQSTTRTGDISFKIIVDHPSVMNLIVDKELNRQDSFTTNQVINSFFAGCKKYDIYELARKFNTVNFKTLNELYQQVLASNKSSEDDINAVAKEIPAANNNSTSDDENKIEGYQNKRFYFNPDQSSQFLNNDPYDEVHNNLITYYENSGNTELSNLIPNNIGDYTSLQTVRTDVGVKLQQGFTIKISFISAKTTVSIVDMKTSITEFFSSHGLGDSGKTIKEYLDNNKLILDFSGDQVGTIDVQNGPSLTQVTCDGIYDNSSTGITKTFACASTVITNITLQPPTPEPEGTNQTNNDNPKQSSLIGNPNNNPNQNIADKYKKSLSKKILRELLTEYDYFETVIQDTPFFFDSIKEKIKFFNPAFHSMTPEGLNSRLTFLNQCVRPGRTIPSIGENGEKIYNDSFNTNFGTPPVLILRIGDFYNCKIIPNNLSFTYDDSLFDLNPEGIGVQPMIATVKIGFNMVGGHGLKEPISKLQNALSFNYYANTEMYDERADITEDTTAIDNELLSAILNNEPVSTINDVSNIQKNAGGEVIGVITENNPDPSGIQTGKISYKKIFDSYIDGQKSYFESFTGFIQKTLDDFNYGVYKQLKTKRLFSKGYSNYLNMDKIEFDIFGRSDNWKQLITNVGNELKQFIDDETETIISQLKLKEVKAVDLDVIKNNYKVLIDEKVNNGFSSLGSQMNEFATNQVNFLQTLRKLDVVSTLTDGKILSDKTIKIYVLTGITENNVDSMTKLVTDYTATTLNFSGFLKTLTTKFIDTTTSEEPTPYFTPFSSMSTSGSTNPCYTLFSNDLIDENKKQTFITNLKKNISTGQTEIIDTAINTQVSTLSEIFKLEKNETKKSFDSILSSTEYLVYRNYNPQDSSGNAVKGVERLANFVTSGGTNTQKSYIEVLYASTNQNTDDTTFNDKITF